MKKVIVRIKDDGQMIDENGTYVVSTSGMSFVFQDFEDSKDKEEEFTYLDVRAQPGADLVRLVELGVTPDDLVKMRASGLI